MYLMRIKTLIPAAAAAALLASGAMAQTTVGGGIAGSTAQGSVAGGLTAGTAASVDHSQRDKHRGDRESRRDQRMATNSASTYGTGSVYTDRNHATGAVTSGGTASGTGSQSASSSVDAYGSVTKNGSEGEVYGDSTANSTVPPK
jgi:hypothetical protein